MKIPDLHREKTAFYAVINIMLHCFLQKVILSFFVPVQVPG